MMNQQQQILTKRNELRQQDYCLATIKLGAHGKKDE